MKPPTVIERDSLLQIIDSSLTFTTRDIVRDISVAAFTAKASDEKVLKRFMVRSISHCKDDSQLPNHEILIIELIDTNSLETYLSILERTPSDVTTVGHSSQGGIAKSFKEVQSSISASLTSSRERSGYHTLNDPDSAPPLHPIVDATTLAFTGVARASMYSVSPVYLANDTFRFGKTLELYVKSLRNIYQIIPLELSFFDFAVLADSIHIEEPNYSSLGTQCYWFASTICNIVEKSYVSTKIITAPTPSSSSAGPISERNDYLPPLSGRAMGLLVTSPDDAAADLVEKFKKNLDKIKKEVSSNHCILNVSTKTLVQIALEWERFHTEERLLNEEKRVLNEEKKMLNEEKKMLTEEVHRLEELLRLNNINPEI